MKFICRFCGVEADKHHPTQVYCSQSCRQRDYLKRKRNGLKTAQNSFSAPSVKNRPSEEKLMNGAENEFIPLFVNNDIDRRGFVAFSKFGEMVGTRTLNEEGKTIVFYKGKKYGISLRELMYQIFVDVGIFDKDGKPSRYVFK